jgi:uncharacterized protein YifN (PemK superfamily)
MGLVEENQKLKGRGSDILRAWANRRPKMVKELTQKGELATSVLLVIDLMRDDQMAMLKAGYHIEAAREIIRDKWFMIPKEENNPNWRLESLL